MKFRHLVMLGVLVACHRKLTADAIEKSAAAIVQKGNLGTSAWIVGPDGAVSALLKDDDGKPVAGTVTGQVMFDDKAVPVQYDPKTGVLTATGPKLDADITPVNYALTVDGKPWNGFIDVPRGGTQDLADTAKQVVASPAPTVGPNGGVVQTVGPDRVEVVANKQNGEVRAYLLDPTSNQPVDPGDRKITIALQGDQPEVVVLAPDSGGHFVVGRVRSRIDPVDVTVAVNDHGVTHAGLIGWSPGSVVFVGPEAPRVHLLAVDRWARPGEVVVGAPGVVVGGPGVLVGGHGVIGGPGVVVGGPGMMGGPPGFGFDHDRRPRS